MSTDYNDYFAHYIGLVNSTDCLDSIEQNHASFKNLLSQVDEEKSHFRYAEDKWSIKELVSHIIDTERIFAYRALRFARNDKADLAGYDENHYAVFSGADERSLAELVHEFDVTRQSSLALFKSFNKEMLERSGTANGIKIDVTSLGYLIAGHCQHHLNILQERYL